MKPRPITHGLGNLTPRVWDYLTSGATIAHSPELALAIERAGKYRRKYRPDPWFIAQVVGRSTHTGDADGDGYDDQNQYRYAHREMTIDDSGVWSAVEDGRTGSYSSSTHPTLTTTGTDYAINLLEAFNTGAGVEAPGIAVESLGDADNRGSAYPAGFELRPIEGNTTDVGPINGDVPSSDDYNGPLVIMYMIRDSTGGLRYVFSETNMHDGACT